MSDKAARDGPKIGAGHAAGMLRQGVKELRATLYPESNVAQPTDLGVYGGATPQEVYDSKQPEVAGYGVGPGLRSPAPGHESVLDEIVKQIEARHAERGRDGPEQRGPERE